MNMRLLWVLFTGAVLCSFDAVKPNNTLTDDGLKGRVRLITEHCYSGNVSKDRLYSVTTSFFDENGNKVRDTVTFIPPENKSFSYSNTWDYKYNNKGWKTEENIYNKDGSLSWKTVYTYDSKGAVVETNRYHADGKPEQKVVFKCDEKGNGIQAESYNSGIKNSTYLCKFDKDNNMTEQFNLDTFWGYLRNIKSYWKYNDSGALVEFSEYDKDTAGIPEKYYSYSYIVLDKEGNWIKRREVSRRHGIDIITFYEREIIYY